MQDTQFKNQLIESIGGGGGGGLVIIEPTQEDDGLYLGYSFAELQTALATGSVLAELYVTGNININICYLKVLGSNAGASFFAEFTNGHTFTAASQTDPLKFQNS